VRLFRRRLLLERVDVVTAERHKVLLRHLDSFSMRNFTNDAQFDDTLPIADGLLEAGSRVSIEALQTAMTEWFRRKSYLGKEEELRIEEQPGME
jgi:hypothetical protein